MYACTRTHTHGKPLTWFLPVADVTNQKTKYFKSGLALGFTLASAVCVEGTCVTGKLKHLRDSAQFFWLFLPPWQSVIMDVCSNEEVHRREAA